MPLLHKRTLFIISALMTKTLQRDLFCADSLLSFKNCVNLQPIKTNLYTYKKNL